MNRLKNKFSGYFVFLLILTAAVVILFSRKDGTLMKKNIDFAPENSSAINRIEISKDDEVILLERNNSQWMLNGIAAARNERIQFLLESLERIEIVSPASKMVQDSVIAHLISYGKYVQLSGRGNTDKHFYIYFDTTGVAGTYMMTEKSGIPYMVRLKGYSGNNIENIFSLNFKSWQENILFNFTPDEIREVMVEYPAETEHSFRICRDESDGIVLSDHISEWPKEKTNVQEIQDYLYFFINVRFQYPEKRIPDHVFSAQPFAKLSLIAGADRKINLEAFHLPASNGGSVNHDLNRFVALINNEQDTIILNYTDMDPIFRQIEDFQKK